MRTTTRTTVQSATRDARNLVRKHLNVPAGTRVHIDSNRVAGADLTVRMGTTILFPDTDDYLTTTRALADAVEALPGYHSMCWNRVSISYLREI